MRRNIIRSGIYNSFVPMDSRELFTFRFLIKIPRSREGASLSRIERKFYESLRFSFHFQFETSNILIFVKYFNICRGMFVES